MYIIIKETQNHNPQRRLEKWDRKKKHKDAAVASSTCWRDRKKKLLFKILIDLFNKIIINRRENVKKKRERKNEYWFDNLSYYRHRITNFL